jgi:hypothetical protein
MSGNRFASSLGLRALAAVALVLLFAGASFGSTIDHGTGLAGLFQTITFSEFSFAPNTPITTQFSSLGVSFTPQLYYDTPDTLYANIVGDRLQNYYPCCNAFSIFFTNVQSAVDFNFVSQPGTTTFTARLGGVIQESFTTSTDLLTTPNFYGFQGISLDEIDVSVSSVNGAMQLDNIQLGVPEPGGWALLASGLMALAAFSRRKKAR